MTQPNIDSPLYIRYQLPDQAHVGCRTCRCHSHLFVHEDPKSLRALIEATLVELRLTSVSGMP